jgi:hypothetical protein
MTLPTVHSQDELLRELRKLPGSQYFDILGETQFIQWWNNHCFFWKLTDGVWSCEEL